MSKTIALLSAALVCLLPGSTASLRAQGTPRIRILPVCTPRSTRSVRRDAAAPRASAGGGDSRRGAAAATRAGYRRACGPAGDRAEADARVPGQMGGHAEVAHGRIV